MDEMAVLELFRRRIWLIVALGIVAAFAGYAISFVLPQKYTATALVLVRPQQDVKLETRSANREFLDLPMGAANIETPSKTYIEIVKSPAFVGQLVQKLGLDKVESKKSGFISRHLPESIKRAFDDLKQFVRNALSVAVYGTVIPKDNFAQAVKNVETNLALEARAETYLFTIKYTAKDARLASEVANSAAGLLVATIGELRQSEGQRARDALRTELDKTRQQVRLARENVEAFKQAHNMFKYDSEYESQLKVIADLQTELGKLEETVAGLRAVASQNNASTSSVTLAAKQANILSQLRDRQAKLSELPEMEREFKALDLAEKSALTAYEAVDKEYQEAQIKGSYAEHELELVGQAVPPQYPSGPTHAVFALGSLLGGLVMGAGLVFLLEYLNRSVRSIREVEDLVGLKVLATIPRMPAEELQLAAS